MVIFHSYVSLPEGISIALRTLVNMRLVIITIYHRPREELELLELRCFTTYWMGMFPSWGRRPAWVPAKQQKNTIYLVGGLEHLDRFGFFFHILGMSSSQLPNILQDGLKPPTSDWYPDLPSQNRKGTIHKSKEMIRICGAQIQKQEPWSYVKLGKTKVGLSWL